MMAVLVFLLLHGPDGHEIRVNPESVVSMHSKKDDRADARLFAEGANCLVNMADGKALAVREQCTDIQRLLEAGK